MHPYDWSKKTGRNWWGVIPLAIVIFCIAVVFLIQHIAHVKLRSIPFQLLLWGLVCSVLVLLVWLVRKLYGRRFVYPLACVAAVLLSIVILGYAMFFSAFSWQPEHVVEKYGIRMVAQVNSFLDMTVEYYPYRNILFCGAEELGYEWYGSGGTDPIANGYRPQRWTFYDEDGNIIDAGVVKSR